MSSKKETSLPSSPRQSPISQPVPKLQNVVVTCDLQTRINLEHVALAARNAEYKPHRFKAVTLRIRTPRATALLFATGKVVVMGSKSYQLAVKALRKFAKIVNKVKGGENNGVCKLGKVIVRNMVANCTLQFQVSLELLASKCYQFCEYEPELFPGLVYRMIKPKVVVLVFVSGNVVITGATSMKDVQEAFGNIYPLLTLHAKKF